MSTQAAVAALESVKVERKNSGILVDGIPVLRGLLVKFMSGATAHSGATMRHQPDATAFLLSLVQEGNDIPFLKRLFDEMNDTKNGLKKRGQFHRSYDYDGVGSFFKSTLDVLDLAGEEYVPAVMKDPFLLKLSAAYVGTKVEDGLAAAAGIKQGLSWAGVELTLASEGPSATIDVAALVEPIRSVLGLSDMPAERIAQLMMPHRENEGLLGVDIKRVDDECAVSMGIDSLSLLAGYKPEQNITREGAVIRGLRADRWASEDAGQYARLRVNIAVSSLNQWRGNEYTPVPVLDPQRIIAMLDLSQRIAAAYMAVA